MKEIEINLGMVGNDSEEQVVLDMKKVLAYAQFNEISDCTAMRGREAGGKPFIVGASPLGGSETLWKQDRKYNGFMARYPLSQSGTVLKLDIRTEQVTDKIVIEFDNAIGLWAEELYVDLTAKECLNLKALPEYKRRRNRSSLFACELDAATHHIILITQWNKPNYPVRITGISFEYTESYASDSIESIKWSNIMIDDAYKPTYGITAAYAEANLIDSRNTMESFTRANLITRYVPCRISLVEETGKENRAEWRYISEKWVMKYGENSFKLNMADNIEKLRSIRFQGLPKIDAAITLKRYIEQFNELLAINELPLIQYSDFANEYAKIIIELGDIDGETLYDAIKMLCEITHSVIYCNSDDKFIMSLPG